MAFCLKFVAMLFLTTCGFGLGEYGKRQNKLSAVICGLILMFVGVWGLLQLLAQFLS